MTNKHSYEKTDLFFILLLVFLILVNIRNLNMMNFVDLHNIYICTTSVAWRAMTTANTFLLQVDSLRESQYDRMVWFGRGIQNHPVLNTFHGQGYQVAQSSV